MGFIPEEYTNKKGKSGEKSLEEAKALQMI